jgi:hypothetical protein
MKILANNFKKNKSMIVAFIKVIFSKKKYFHRFLFFIICISLLKLNLLLRKYLNEPKVKKVDASFLNELRISKFNNQKRIECMKKISQQILHSYEKLISREHDTVFIGIPDRLDYEDNLIWHGNAIL